MQKIHILSSCNQHKNHTTLNPLFYYCDSMKDIKKILNYIKNNLDSFFDGEEAQRKESFEDFKNSIKDYGGSIHKAFNTSTNIYALSTELEHIKNL